MGALGRPGILNAARASGTILRCWSGSQQASAWLRAGARANVAFVPLGTPLLAGPGAIVATMLFVQRIHGPANVLALALAILAVMVVVWLAMRFSTVIHRILTDNGVELLTRIAGLLLSAIAVQLVATAVLAFAHQH